MSVTTQAVVNVKAVRQSLDRMSRDERVQLIRASGDPRVAVRISRARRRTRRTRRRNPRRSPRTS